MRIRSAHIPKLRRWDQATTEKTDAVSLGNAEQIYLIKLQHYNSSQSRLLMNH